MMHIISYDLHGEESDYVKLYEVINGLGDAYFCLESTVFLCSPKSAGAIDTVLRSSFPKKISFVVVDITGIDEEKYFGSVVPKQDKGSFWKWMLEHKE